MDPVICRKYGSSPHCRVHGGFLTVFSCVFYEEGKWQLLLLLEQQKEQQPQTLLQLLQQIEGGSETFSSFIKCVTLVHQPMKMPQASDFQSLYPIEQKSSITGCPSKFAIGSEMFASKASIVYKKSLYFAPKNCFLSLFCKL